MIHFITVYIVDISGFTDSVRDALSRLARRCGHHGKGELRLRPLDCSSCMCFWLTISLGLWEGRINLTVVSMACISSLLAVHTGELINVVSDNYTKLLRNINK